MKVYEIISDKKLEEGLGVADKIKKAVDRFIPTAAEMTLTRGTARGFMANLAKIIPNAAILVAFEGPIAKYFKEISDADKAVAAGTWTKDTYDKYKAQRATILIDTISGDLLMLGISKIGFGIIGSILTRIPVIGKKLKQLSASGVGQVAKGVTKTGQAYLMDSLNNKESMVALVTSVIGTDTAPGQLFVKATDFLNKKVDDAINYASGTTKPETKQQIKPEEPTNNDVDPISGLKWSNL